MKARSKSFNRASAPERHPQGGFLQPDDAGENRHGPKAIARRILHRGGADGDRAWVGASEEERATLFVQIFLRI